jgi:hypothetical protein
MKRKTQKKKKRKSGGSGGPVKKPRSTTYRYHPYTHSLVSSIKNQNNSTITGNNLRAALVKLCKRKKDTEYDNLTQKIIKNDTYRNAFIEYLDEQIHTFGDETLQCLVKCFKELKEHKEHNIIIKNPYSNYKINYLVLVKYKEDGDEKEYQKLTNKLIQDHINGDTSFLMYFDEEKKMMSDKELKYLYECIQRFQEDAVGGKESWNTMEYITKERKINL